MSKTVKTAEQKKSDKAAYDKARRAAKKWTVSPGIAVTSGNTARSVL